jgi:hypothetical protein
LSTHEHVYLLIGNVLTYKHPLSATIRQLFHHFRVKFLWNGLHGGNVPLILNKSKILHLHNYAKEKVLKSFEMNPWNLLAHGQQLGLEIHFPLTKIHLPRVTGILENWCSI